MFLNFNLDFYWLCIDDFFFLVDFYFYGSYFFYVLLIVRYFFFIELWSGYSVFLGLIG